MELEFSLRQAKPTMKQISFWTFLFGQNHDVIQSFPSSALQNLSHVWEPKTIDSVQREWIDNKRAIGSFG
jgi:hypothetical protein